MSQIEPPTLKSVERVADSNRSEIVLGVVAPVGVNRDAFIERLEAELERVGYALAIWRVSDQIERLTTKDLLDGLGEAGIPSGGGIERTRILQKLGTKLRKDFGEDVLVRAVVQNLSQAREESPGRFTSKTKNEAVPVAHLIWSLKHPKEVALLKLVYGPAFHLIGLYATEEHRVEEFRRLGGFSDKEIRERLELDQDESGNNEGQRTRDTFQLADVFINWGRRKDACSLARFVDILFAHPLVTPTQDEHCMFLAFSGALRSGELSRQVGAVLLSSDGDVVAIGANDVPKSGGGLYWPGKHDDRDLVKGFDSNVRVREQVEQTIVDEIKREIPNVDLAGVKRALPKSMLRDITEFGRAVHAEMEALLSCARSGHSTRGATLYVTTYPCHNCARHLIAAGVSRVVYVEPYPKSRARQLHFNDIEEVEPGSGHGLANITFEPYLGVGPRRFYDYFSMTMSSGRELVRKGQDGKAQVWDGKVSAPRTPIPILTYLEVEEVLALDLIDTIPTLEEGPLGPGESDGERD